MIHHTHISRVFSLTIVFKRNCYQVYMNYRNCRDMSVGDTFVKVLFSNTHTVAGEGGGGGGKKHHVCSLANEASSFTDISML